MIIREALEFVNPNPVEQQVKMPYYQQGYPPPIFQPPVDVFSQKLSYEREKAAIAVQKERELSVQRLELEKLKQEIKFQNQVRRDMLSFEVCRDAMGRMIYSRMADDQEKICSKILLNVNAYRAVNFMSFFPQTHVVLSVSWEGCREPIYFENSAEGIPVQKFLKKLKAKGIFFRVSKKNELEVADALLAYSLNTQEEYEIPFYRGWNVMENGRWHFAKGDEITMKEVLDYE